VALEISNQKISSTPSGSYGQGNLEVLPAGQLFAEVLINLMQRDPTVHMVTVDNVFG
jgi:hypothetical protein